MKKKIVIASILLLGSSLALIPSGEAKRVRAHQEYTVSDRQVSLEKKIDTAYKDNQLTLQEADDLRGKIKKVKDKEQKMKDNNGGKLSYSDKTTLEKSLNSVSEKLHKKMLEKESSRTVKRAQIVLCDLAGKRTVSGYPPRNILVFAWQEMLHARHVLEQTGAHKDYLFGQMN